MTKLTKAERKQKAINIFSYIYAVLQLLFLASAIGFLCTVTIFKGFELYSLII